MVAFKQLLLEQFTISIRQVDKSIRKQCPNTVTSDYEINQYPKQKFDFVHGYELY